jgi:hypothetical protein
MRQEERFNDILNECLDRILKGETIEQCLLSYQKQATELEPLLKTAKAARVISSVQPRPEYKVEARRKFQAALIEMKVKQNESKANTGRQWNWRWNSGWAIALVALIIVVLGGGGTVAAASNSMPDNVLFSIKLATEKAQLSLASGEVAKTELNAKFADRRTDELVYMAAQGDVQQVLVAAGRLNTNLSNITELAAGNDQPKSESTGEDTPLMAPQPMELSKNAAPPQMNTATDLSPVATPDIAVAAVPSGQIPPDTAAGGPGASATPEPNAEVSIAAPAMAPGIALAPAPAPLARQTGENTAVVTSTADAALQNNTESTNMTASKYEKLRKIIQENYEKRSTKLEEALNIASAEVRPAIRRAISESDLEYERALRNLEEAESAESAQN